MRSRLIAISILASLSGLVAACYGRALFSGEQFAYRDAFQYYYPLHSRVQDEWNSGRWPLWEPAENGGVPLLGNPTAAVLYPGKLIFALVRYPLAARLYVVSHTLLAFASTLVLARHWGVSWAGSALGAAAYAFGGPVLFQHCNVIFLVGAAWLPLGLRAADRWLRLGRRRALGELAAVLAMETLGGDPQAAYLTGVCAAGYAVALSRQRARPAGDSDGVTASGAHVTSRIVVPAVVWLVVAWVVAVLAAAWWVPALRPAAAAGGQAQPGLSSSWAGMAIAAAWALAGCWLLVRWRRQRGAAERPVLAPMLLGLVAAALVAAAMSAAQLLPVLEFIGQSGRASGDAPHDVYPFSFHPIRLVEFAWPNVFGASFRGNTDWLRAVPVRGSDADSWTPTAYLGGLTLVLALGGSSWGFGRDQAPWQRWLGCIMLFSLLASFGEYGSPLWLARTIPQAESLFGSGSLAGAGSHRTLRDGDGGVYWLLAAGLPGFGRFRYPSKLLTFTALGLSLLAAQGWDALARGDERARHRAAVWSATLLALSLVGIGLSASGEGAFVGWLDGKKLYTIYGPLDAPGALAAVRTSLVQTAVVMAASLVLVHRLFGRRPLAAAVMGLTVVACDLAVANARFVATVPQSVIDAPSEALAMIERAEKERPRPGPYRVYRVLLWAPTAWAEARSNQRVRDFVEWDRATLAPKQGITLGVQYTMTLSVTELYDFRWFVSNFYFRARERAARALGVEAGTTLLVHSRRGFNLWNTRYFILPHSPIWDDPFRGIASFLERTERVFPPPDAFIGAGGRAKEEAWARAHDFQIRRNLDDFPRAWVVHDARTLPPFRALSRAGRGGPTEEMLFSNDMTWPDPTRVVYDPRQIVWVEEADRPELAPFLTGGSPSAKERVAVVRYQSDRVELEAVLERPGLVVLADVYYPGWSLTIDGRPARLYRANRLMRGAALAAGRHTLVYTFRPLSFRVGLYLSCAGLVALGLLALLPARPELRSGTDREDGD